MRSLQILIVLIVLSAPVRAQTAPSGKVAEAAVYFEMWGANSYASVNVDYALSRFVLIRLGAGYIGVPFGLGLKLPFGESINGRATNNLEFSAGFTFPVLDEIDKTTGNITIAYRHCPLEGGFMYRIGMTFLFETEYEETVEWTSTWIGYRYKSISTRSSTAMNLIPSLSVGYTF